MWSLFSNWDLESRCTANFISELSLVKWLIAVLLCKKIVIYNTAVYLFCYLLNVNTCGGFSFIIMTSHHIMSTISDSKWIFSKVETLNALSSRFLIRHIERIVLQNKGYTRWKTNRTHYKTRTFSDFQLIISVVQLRVNARAAATRVNHSLCRMQFLLI